MPRFKTWLFAIAVSAMFFSTPCEAHAQEFSGRDRYETAQLEAVAAFPSGSDTAILASGEGWADALSATSLAGALDAPMLFTPSNSLSPYTQAALAQLKPSTVILIGSETALDDTVMHQVSQHPGIKSTVRLGGNNRIETQMEIYGYGKDRGLWTSDTVIVANAWGFADALTASPFTYKNGCPLFLVNGSFSSEQERALLELMPSQVLIMGSENVVDEYTYGYMEALSLHSSPDGTVLRFAGTDRFDTNLRFARWAVSEGHLSWGRVAVTRSDAPFDALAGAALQGTRSSVLILASSKYDATVQELIGQRGRVSDVSFFGGTPSVPASLRNYIKSYLGFYIPQADVWTSCVLQYPELPTGCEALALTNALSAYGYRPGKFEIVDQYLPYSYHDFVTCYVGNPYSSGGAWNSCCAPAIVRAANNYLTAHGSPLHPYEITGTSFENLLTYIERGYPVIAWSTVNQVSPNIIWASQWYNNHRYDLWNDTHTVVLSGFNRVSGTVTIADSISGYVTMSASRFKWIWATTGSQAVVIM
ncbi:MULTISPECIES: cell wall-binding repeat-containing protein [Gordonibacter]|uniref:cell wall-binding repeat-containing protein n=1 Tax=Gordonibacter TaxID=644652 RepID=UPI001D063355|nr:MULTISPECIES: cell wall-binding repeat-containing protein [Gordonibacter]MCB6312916.1 cell wall-binding repeat-containing protein [Gordonibacter pamelaeae]MCB6561715.1 cell wall-binding repeat-containing protein [Gordonibacter urolithinfaciens]MCB7085706.1 cell wall-binding repeat-containing protein [Gordonibacter urolithinfaciens]